MKTITVQQWSEFRALAHKKAESEGKPLPSDAYLEDVLAAHGLQKPTWTQAEITLLFGGKPIIVEAFDIQLSTGGPDPFPEGLEFGTKDVSGSFTFQQIRPNRAQYKQGFTEDFQRDVKRMKRMRKLPKPLGITYELAPEEEQQPERKPKKSSLFHDPKKPKRKDWWNR